MSTVYPPIAGYFFVDQRILYPIVTLSVICFTYGIYVLLFGIYMHMMCSRQQTGERPNNLYLILTVVLFVLSTTFVVNEVVYYAHGITSRLNTNKDGDPVSLNGREYLNDVQRRIGYCIGDIVPVISNVAAEWMLCHRCYVVWNSRRLVAIPMILISVTLNGFIRSILTIIGITTVTRDPANATRLLQVAANFGLVYSVGITINMLVITLFTAGRIWWVHQQVYALGIYTSDRAIDSVTRLVLESGMIYPILSAVDMIVERVVPPNQLVLEPFVLVALSAGIAPTLIMVRAKLGKNIESLQSAISDIHFTSQLRQQDVVGTRVATQTESHSFSRLDMGESSSEGAGHSRVTLVNV